jgi:hypothetical protein
MILRTKRRRKFTMISNTPIKDEHLSAEALGVLLYLLSHQDDWRLTHQDLMRRFKIGRDKVYGIITELKEAGYLEKELRRAPNGQVIGCEYLIGEEPHCFASLRAPTSLPRQAS